MQHNRRKFLIDLSRAAAGAGLAASLPVFLSGCAGSPAGSQSQGALAGGQNGFFEISLAQWSLHRALRAGQMTNLDFPTRARNEFNIGVVEYVSVFFNKQEKDQTYLNQLLQRTKDLGVVNHLIMVDGEGALGDLDPTRRNQSVENHHKWIDAAKYLGCTTIRVNAAGRGTYQEVQDAAVDGLGRLAEYGAQNNINVVVENHGGYSSSGKWLSDVMKQVNNPHLGTLPDFGNFRISPTEEYDRYQGVRELMPFAKAVSAKSYDFDAEGNETTIDYRQMLQIVKDAGFRGYIGVEYEGSRLSEDDGIKATRDLLLRLRAEMS